SDQREGDHGVGVDVSLHNVELRRQHLGGQHVRHVGGRGTQQVVADVAVVLKIRQRHVAAGAVGQDREAHVGRIDQGPTRPEERVVDLRQELGAGGGSRQVAMAVVVGPVADRLAARGHHVLLHLEGAEVHGAAADAGEAAAALVGGDAGGDEGVIARVDGGGGRGQGGGGRAAPLICPRARRRGGGFWCARGGGAAPGRRGGAEGL